ncbi:MAG: DUF1801 domain-containing protein [Alteraurantiacibacter sp.]
MPKKGVTLDQVLAAPDWHVERKALRAILLDCGLAEAIKWGQLCYMTNGHNVALVFALKDTIGVGFIKGTLLDDPDGELVLPGPNSKAVMRMDFTSLEEIRRRENRLRAFVAEAMANEAAGKVVARDASQMPDWPDELDQAFAADPDYRAAFTALTPGRQRGLLIDITAPKSSAARARRVARHRDRVLAGKGLHDR